LNRTGIGEMPQATPRRPVNTDGNWPRLCVSAPGLSSARTRWLQARLPKRKSPTNGIRVGSGLLTTGL